MYRAIHHILTHCGGVEAGDTVFIVHDPTTRDIADAFADIARDLDTLVGMMELLRGGQEPMEVVARIMAADDLTISLCQKSLAHTKARLGAKRFLSLPGYSWNVLNHPAVMVDYEAQAPIVKRFADAFTAGFEIRVVAEGTDVTMGISGRSGNYCPGFVRCVGDLGSPPDIEANVAPIEGSAHGFAKFVYPDFKTTDFDNLAECGVGLNPQATVPGPLLVAEGAFGCVHFGFGSNHTIGGRRDVGYHFDRIIPKASLWVDGVQMLKDGELC